MKRLFFVVILSVSVAFLASGCLWGVVTDADTGAGITGATVTYTDSEGHSQSTTTITNGLYVSTSRQGRYLLLGQPRSR